MVQKRKTTIYDIAELAESSASTVSAVLSGQWQKRRIKRETAEKIQEIAREHGYTINLQARGLRKSRSGLIGLMIPTYDSRFFSQIAERFGAKARERGLCPIVVSTLRSPEEEQRAAETLISYSVDALFICGATEPDAVTGLCRFAGIRQINLDLPGTLSPSVVSDNFWGAARLTEALIDRLDAQVLVPGEAPPIYFLGGNAADFATSHRLAGFRKTLEARGFPVPDDHVSAAGYLPDANTQATADLVGRIGHFPEALFVNSISAFEGLMGYIKTMALSDLEDAVIGLFDWDPLISRLPFEVLMVRQNTDALVDRAFELIDRPVDKTAADKPNVPVEVRPELLFEDIAG